MRLPIPLAVLWFAALLCGVARADDAAPSVRVGGDSQQIEASATIRIHAAREVVWELLKSCAEAVRIVPGLQLCEVREVAPDASWALIRQVMEYSRLLPRMTYDVRASYARPDSISFERIAGDLIRLKGIWTLESDGGDTIAHYGFWFEPGFWVPNWFVRAALKRDLPRMLQTLRRNAEAAQPQNLG